MKGILWEQKDPYAARRELTSRLAWLTVEIVDPNDLIFGTLNASLSSSGR
jgi:hypothetical protein